MSANSLTFQWFRDGMPISSGSPFSISSTSNSYNHSSELSISPASFDLCGVYHCMVSDGVVSEASPTASLQVVGEWC